MTRNIAQLRSFSATAALLVLPIIYTCACIRKQKEPYPLYQHELTTKMAPDKVFFSREFVQFRQYHVDKSATMTTNVSQHAKHDVTHVRGVAFILNAIRTLRIQMNGKSDIIHVDINIEVSRRKPHMPLQAPNFLR